MKPFIPRTCSVDGCQSGYYGGGYCATHYQRMRKHGSTDRHVRIPRRCEVVGCEGKYIAKGLCTTHYARVKYSGSAELRQRGIKESPPCAETDCGRESKCRGLCTVHYARWFREARKTPCSVESCIKLADAKGLCDKHYRRWRRYDDPIYPVRGTDGRHHSSKGYVVVQGCHGHPNADRHGAIMEHRLVMSRVLGRALLPGENVHHKNGKRDDNDPSNLELWVRAQPSGQRPADLVAFARMILERYADAG